MNLNQYLIHTYTHPHTKTYTIPKAREREEGIKTDAISKLTRNQNKHQVVSSVFKKKKSYF